MCGTRGALVSSGTVEALIEEAVDTGAYDLEIFSLCVDPICEMTYFSADYGYLYLKRNIKVALDYKEDTEDKYLCYCNEITKDQVTRLVKLNPNLTIKELFDKRGLIKPEKCRKKNPFGFCCLPDIKRFMEDIVLGRAHI